MTMVKDMVVIVGQSGSGKTTLAKALENNGYKRIVTYTTRPMRDGEVNGVDYHFITMEEFKKKFCEDFFAEITTYQANFGGCAYGSAMEDYNKPGKHVMVLNPEGVMALNTDIRLVYLDHTKNVLAKRVKGRGDALDEFYRRYDEDAHKFFNMTCKMKPEIHVKQTTKTDIIVNRILAGSRKLRGL